MTRRRSIRRVGFTLFEVLVSVGLITLLVIAMAAFLSDALRIRTRVGDRVSRGLAAEATITEVERALATCIVADREFGSGIRGDESSIDVLRVGLATWRLGTLEPTQAFVPIERCRVRFLPGEGHVAIGRDEREPTPIPGELHRVAFRYFDGKAWVTSFDSAAAGRLPVAVEVSIWLEAPRGEPVVEERPETDEIAAATPPPTVPPDRRRVIAIPDPAGEDAGEGSP